MFVHHVKLYNFLKLLNTTFQDITRGDIPLVGENPCPPGSLTYLFHLCFAVYSTKNNAKQGGEVALNPTPGRSFGHADSCVSLTALINPSDVPGPEELV
jgi:hypothetical protein